MNFSDASLEVLFEVYEKAQGQAVFHILLGMFMGAAFLQMAARLCPLSGRGQVVQARAPHPLEPTSQSSSGTPSHHEQRANVKDASLQIYLAPRSKVYHANASCPTLRGSAEIKQYPLCFYCARAGSELVHGVRRQPNRACPDCDVSEHED